MADNISIGQFSGSDTTDRLRAVIGAVTDVLATLKARVEQLEAELAAEQQRSAGHRADFEHERERADRMVTTQDKLVAQLEGLRALLTPRTWREMPWRERWRWLRSTG